jgi:hypothetical protein
LPKLNARAFQLALKNLNVKSEIAPRWQLNSQNSKCPGLHSELLTPTLAANHPAREIHSEAMPVAGERPCSLTKPRTLRFRIAALG